MHFWLLSALNLQLPHTSRQAPHDESCLGPGPGKLWQHVLEFSFLLGNFLAGSVMVFGPASPSLWKHTGDRLGMEPSVLPLPGHCRSVGKSRVPMSGLRELPVSLLAATGFLESASVPNMVCRSTCSDVFHFQPPLLSSWASSAGSGIDKEISLGFLVCFL